MYKMRQKGYFTRACKGGQQNYIAKGINIAWNNNHIKTTKEYLIRHFAFCYNSAYKVYKDAKYGIK